MFRRTETTRRIWLNGLHLAGLGVCVTIIVAGIGEARADGKAAFGGPAAETQLAAYGPPARVDRLEDAADLAAERAKGATLDAIAPPGEGGKVAVILWDDAWSELQRRARSASSATTAGSNAGSSLAGSSGSRTN